MPYSSRMLTYRSQSRGSAHADRPRVLRWSPLRRRGTLLTALSLCLLMVSSITVSAASAAAPVRQARELGTATISHASAPAAKAGQTATGLRSVAGWQALFDARSAADDSRVYSRLSTSSDSWDYYNLAFGVDAFTAMFRATGNTKYLDKSLSYVNNVIARAKPSSSLGTQAYGDSYLGWVSQRSDVKGQEVPLFESFLWRYVTEMLWAIHQNPTVYNAPAYKSQYDSILAFTERNIFDKWYTRNDGHGGGGAGFPGMYRQNTNMASHWAFISLFVSKLTTDPTRQARARTVYTNIDGQMPVYGSSLRHQFLHPAAAPAAYVWSSVWDASASLSRITTSNVQDVPHASGEVAYIIDAYEFSTGAWTSTDITALSHTLTDLIWRKDGTYAAYVDGSGPGNGVVFDGFMKLGRYNAAIQKRLETYTGAISDNNYAVISFLANGALNAKYLGA